jgi:hypothetical protein
MSCQKPVADGNQGFCNDTGATDLYFPLGMWAVGSRYVFARVMFIRGGEGHFARAMFIGAVVPLSTLVATCTSFFNVLQNANCKWRDDGREGL